MLEKSFGLLFYLKPPKAPSVLNLRTIYLRITVNGIHRDISVKRQWEVSRWNTDPGRAAGNKEDAKELNSYLELVAAKVYQAKKQLLDADKEITADSIKNILQGKEEERHMILAAFKHHNEQMQALIGSDFAKATYTRYKTAHDHTEKFIKWKYGVSDLDVK